MQLNNDARWKDVTLVQVGGSTLDQVALTEIKVFRLKGYFGSGCDWSLADNPKMEGERKGRPKDVS